MILSINGLIRLELLDLLMRPDRDSSLKCQVFIYFITGLDKINLDALVRSYKIFYGLFTLYGPQREKPYLCRSVNNKGADQPAHLPSLISAFVIRFFESILSLAKFQFSC